MKYSEELVCRLLKQSILTLCRETLAFREKLEIDGIVCLAVDGVEQHVVKIHEVFQNTLTHNAHSSKKESPHMRLPTTAPISSATAQETPERADLGYDYQLTNGNSSSPRLDSALISQNRKIFSQLFETTAAPPPIDASLHLKQEPPDETCSDTSNHSERLTPSALNKPEVLSGDTDKMAISNAKNILCKKCGKTLDDVSAFENHNITSHGQFTCLICLSTFTSRNNMKRHIRLHTGLKPYVCHKCPESFSRNDDFKRHLLRHTFQKPFRCVTCQSGFSDRSCLKAHMNKDHRCSIYHVCTTCGECYIDGQMFNEHRQTHDDVLDYRCSICSFSGSNALMYNKHMLTHGPRKKYVCDHCSVSFYDPFPYTSHMKQHKGDENVQAYGCCFCPLVLTSYEQFQRHEHTHIHAKQHMCRVCQKTFRYPSNLREHMLTHIPKSDLMESNNSIDANTYSPSASMATKPELEINEKQTTVTSDVTRYSPMLSNALMTNHVEHVIDENSGDGDKSMENFQIEPEGNVSGSSEYWCTECQHGFGTEQDLQSHIMKQHEQNGEDESLDLSTSYVQEEPRNASVTARLRVPSFGSNTQPYDLSIRIPKPQNDTTNNGHATADILDAPTQDFTQASKHLNKRKREFLSPKRSKIYAKDAPSDAIPEVIDCTTNGNDQNFTNIPLPVFAEMDADCVLIDKTDNDTMENDNKAYMYFNKRNKGNASRAKRNGSHEKYRHSSSKNDSSHHSEGEPNEHKDGHKSHTNSGMSIVMEGMKLTIRRESAPSSTLPLDINDNAVTQQFKNSTTEELRSNNDTDIDDNGENDCSGSPSGEHSSSYGKGSVLGMDTEFSEAPNRKSPTTINLKVRNPGFEKVVTPVVLFETKAPFTCEICEETFKDFKTFDEHGVWVHRRFMCSYCGKAFTSRPNRERHVRYHTGEKPYKCDLCTVSFFRGDDLKYHRTTKHADVKPFTCGACHASFAYPKDLEKHLRVHPDHKLG